jgi:hypothetical protein
MTTDTTVTEYSMQYLRRAPPSLAILAVGIHRNFVFQSTDLVPCNKANDLVLRLYLTHKAHTCESQSERSVSTFLLPV